MRSQPCVAFSFWDTLSRENAFLVVTGRIPQIDLCNYLSVCYLISLESAYLKETLEINITFLKLTKPTIGVFALPLHGKRYFKKTASFSNSGLYKSFHYSSPNFIYQNSRGQINRTNNSRFRVIIAGKEIFQKISGLWQFHYIEIFLL